MLVVERPLAVARGMTSTLGWSSLSDRCPGGHGATVDLGVPIDRDSRRRVRPVDSTHSPASRQRRHPLGAALSLQQLDTDPYGSLAQMRASEPVSWAPVVDGWLVTRRDLCIEVMRDAELFTVDDPRFSTARVVGPSMLSLDGAEHRRHRDPFADAFRKPEVMRRFGLQVEREARELVTTLAPTGAAEIRRDLAGPLAVRVVANALD